MSLLLLLLSKTLVYSLVFLILSVKPAERATRRKSLEDKKERRRLENTKKIETTIILHPLGGAGMDRQQHNKA